MYLSNQNWLAYYVGAQMIRRRLLISHSSIPFNYPGCGVCKCVQSFGTMFFVIVELMSIKHVLFLAYEESPPAVHMGSRKSLRLRLKVIIIDLDGYTWTGRWSYEITAGYLGALAKFILRLNEPGGFVLTFNPVQYFGITFFLVHFY